jgi:hypothetical protein
VAERVPGRRDRVEFVQEGDPFDATAPPGRTRRRRWPSVLAAVLVAAVVLGAAIVRHSAGRAELQSPAAQRALLDRGAGVPSRIAFGCSRTLQCGGEWGLPPGMVARVRAHFPAAEPVAYAVSRTTDGALQYRHVSFAVRGAALSIAVVARAGRPRSRAVRATPAGARVVVTCEQRRFTVAVGWSRRPAPRAALAALAADPRLTAAG